MKAPSEYFLPHEPNDPKRLLRQLFAIHPFNRDSCYMRVKSPYMARGPGELTAPGGAIVFLFGKEDRDGMATVIYDGQVRRRS